MPRTKPLTQSKQLQDNIKRCSDKCLAECSIMNIKHKDIAEITGLSESAISKQFKNKQITLSTYLAVEILKGRL